MTREEASDILDDYDVNFAGHTAEEVAEAFDVAFKALEQEPCDDEYIKVPKRALKYRTAGMVAYNAEWLKNHFDIERAVICGAQEPCEDCVSRQAVLDLIYNSWAHNGVGENYGELSIDALKALPPVTPAPRIGRWIEYTRVIIPEPINKWEQAWYCSECGYGNQDCEDGSAWLEWKYCPNCGAKMEVGDADED